MNASAPTSRIALRHEVPSTAAMASVVLGIPLLLALLWTAGVFGYIRIAQPDVSSDSLLLLSVGFGLLGGAMLAVLGLLFGLFSLLERGRPRTVPLTGLLINAVILLIMFLLTSGPMR